MDDTVRAIPVNLRPSDLTDIDAFAQAHRVSRSALLRAAIELGLAHICATPSLLDEVIPPMTFNRGRPRTRKPKTVVLPDVSSEAAKPAT